MDTNSCNCTFFNYETIFHHTRINHNIHIISPSHTLKLSACQQPIYKTIVTLAVTLCSIFTNRKQNHYPIPTESNPIKSISNLTKSLPSLHQNIFGSWPNLCQIKSVPNIHQNLTSPSPNQMHVESLPTSHHILAKSLPPQIFI